VYFANVFPPMVWMKPVFDAVLDKHDKRYKADKEKLKGIHSQPGSQVKFRGDAIVRFTNVQFLS